MINSKGLLPSTGNHIQYFLITYNGKEFKAVYLKLTQYCKPTILQLKILRNRYNLYSYGYMLLYLKWIAKKDLLYSMWNSAQCYMAA